MITIWYLTASTGLVPARSCPVIMPGRLTMPTTIIALMVGISPVLTACWIERPCGLPARRAECQQRLDLVALAEQLASQSIETERNAVERVAQDHPQQRDGVLRRIPRSHPHDDGQRHRGHQPRAGPCRGDAPHPDARIADAVRLMAAIPATSVMIDIIASTTYQRSSRKTHSSTSPIRRS